MSSFQPDLSQSDISYLRTDFEKILKDEGINSNEDDKITSLHSKLYICTSGGHLKLEKASIGNWWNRLWNPNYKIDKGTDTYNKLVAIHTSMRQSTSEEKLDKSISKMSPEDILFVKTLDKILANIETRKESGFFKTEKQKETIRDVFYSIIFPSQPKAVGQPRNLQPTPPEQFKGGKAPQTPPDQPTARSAAPRPTQPKSIQHAVPKSKAESPIEKKNQLENIITQRGDRAIGAYAISREHGNPVSQIHIVDTNKKIISHNFEELSNGKLSYKGETYENLENLLLRFHQDNIKESLKDKPPGTFCTARFGAKRELYTVLADKSIKVDEYISKNKEIEKFDVTIPKTGFWGSEKHVETTSSIGMIQQMDSNIKETKGCHYDQKNVMSSMQGKPPGDYLIIKTGNQEHLYTVSSDGTPKKFEIQRAEDNATILYNGISYSNIDTMLLAIDSGLSHTRPTPDIGLVDSILSKAIKDGDPGTCVTVSGAKNKLYFSDSNRAQKSFDYTDNSNLTKNYVIDNKTYENLSDFVQKENSNITPKEIYLHAPSKFTPIQLIEDQVNTINGLKELYFVEVSDAKLKELFAPFTDQGNVFLLRPRSTQSNVPGDFELVAGLCTQGETGQKVEFMWKEPISVLPNGQIQHGNGRIFENFEALKSQWDLKSFIYDSYTCSASEMKDFETTPNSFIIGEQKGEIKVHAKSKDGSREYTLKKTANGFSLQDGSTSINLKGELITSLEAHFKVPFYRTSKQFQAGVQDFLESKDSHNPKRVRELTKETLKNATNGCFVLSQEDNGFKLTTYTLNRTGFPWSYNTNEVKSSIEQTVQVHSNGTVKLTSTDGKVSSFNTIEDFNKYLSEMKSVKMLEIAQKETTQNRQKIETFFDNILPSENARANPSLAEKDLNSYWEVLGKDAANKCLISRTPSKDELVVTYKDESGKSVNIKLKVTHEGVVCGDETIKFEEELKLKNILKGIDENLISFTSDHLQAKTDREAILERATKHPGYIAPRFYEIITSPKQAVESRFNQNLTVLANRNPKDFAIYQDKDETGKKQIYLSYVNDDQKIVDIPIKATSPDDLERKIAEEMGDGKLFTEVQSDITRLQSAFNQKCQEAPKHGFLYRSEREANKMFGELTAFFGTEETKGCWFIRPEESSLLPQSLRLTPSTLDHFVISISPNSHHKVRIDPLTAEFVASDKRYKSLDAAVKGLGGKTSYNELDLIKNKCQAQENKLKAIVSKEMASEKIDSKATEDELSEDFYATFKDFAEGTEGFTPDQCESAGFYPLNEKPGTYCAVWPYKDSDGKEKIGTINFDTRTNPGSLTYKNKDGVIKQSPSFEALIHVQIHGEEIPPVQEVVVPPAPKVPVFDMISLGIEKNSAFVDLATLRKTRGNIAFTNTYALTYDGVNKTYKLINYVHVPSPGPKEDQVKWEIWDISASSKDQIKITRQGKEKSYASIDALIADQSKGKKAAKTALNLLPVQKKAIEQLEDESVIIAKTRQLAGKTSLERFDAFMKDSLLQDVAREDLPIKSDEKAVGEAILAKIFIPDGKNKLSDPAVLRDIIDFRDKNPGGAKVLAILARKADILPLLQEERNKLNAEKEVVNTEVAYTTQNIDLLIPSTSPSPLSRLKFLFREHPSVVSDISNKKLGKEESLYLLGKIFTDEDGKVPSNLRGEILKSLVDPDFRPYHKTLDELIKVTGISPMTEAEQTTLTKALEEDDSDVRELKAAQDEAAFVDTKAVGISKEELKAGVNMINKVSSIKPKIFNFARVLAMAQKNGTPYTAEQKESLRKQGGVPRQITSLTIGSTEIPQYLKNLGIKNNEQLLKLVK